MEVHARAPDPLSKDGDMVNNWHSWKEDFIIFMKVTGYIDKPNELRANLLKNRIGKIGIDAIQSMSFDNPQDKNDMDILITKLEDYFNPPKNVVFERYQFFTMFKKQNESIEQCIKNLREKAKTCNFGELTDGLIRDKIILDIHDKILRKKLFEVVDLDLPKLVTIYNDYSINLEKMKQITQQNKTESTVNSTSKVEPTDLLKNFTTKGCCWKCNHQHPLGKCPAWRSKCTKCGELNHFTQCCRGFKPKSKPKVNEIVKIEDQVSTLHLPQVDKNLLDPTKRQTFPEIPTSSIFGIDTFSDDNFHLTLHLLNTCSTNPSLNNNNNNTASSSVQLHEMSQYNYSDISEVKSDWTFDLHNKDETSKTKATHSDTYKKWNNISSRNALTENVTYNIYIEELETGCSSLGSTNLQRLQYNPLKMFVLMMFHMLRQIFMRQADYIERNLIITLNMFATIIFCSRISQNRSQQ